MNDAEKQLLKALRTTSFNNAATAERLEAIARDYPDLARELRAMGSQLLRDADTMEIFVKEIHEGRIIRSS